MEIRFRTNYDNDKAISHVKNCQQCRVTSYQQDVRITNASTFDPLFLFEGTSTEGPATSSSSAAPSEILLFDILRSTVTPAKI